VRDFLSGEKDTKPENLALLIGLGDFVFPSLLVASIYVASESHVPVVTTIVGIVVATIVLRDSLERADGGLPALPYLNTGAIVGYGVGLVLLL
jgi:presenilin-like A22 family membrane protease